VSLLLLDDVARFLRRFVVMSDDQAAAVTLWAAHTHAITAAESTPYLAVMSAEKQSGKTTLRETLELLVREPLPASSISDAALFRAVAKLTPTVLLEEADAIFKARDREELRGLLNAGYRRGAVAYRMGGANKTTLEQFPVFCCKAFFGIGDFLPDTLADRAIPIRLQRRLREETIDRFRRRLVVDEGFMLRDRLADWLEPQLDHLREQWPELPDELDDRAQDVWEPLLAIADLAGGGWPAQARRAALSLSTGEEHEDDSLTVRLLRDIRDVFGVNGDGRLGTADLLERLHAIEESSWGDFYGKPLSAHRLSKLLRPYRIKTMMVWHEGESVRGYKLEQFADAFARVLGDRGDRSDRSKAASQAGPVAPVAPVAWDTNEPPLAGDPDFLEYLLDCGNRGLVTEAEWMDRVELHELIVRAAA
jgi:hypothetical protein